jgi:hypothetical protein
VRGGRQQQQQQQQQRRRRRRLRSGIAPVVFLFFVAIAAR